MRKICSVGYFVLATSFFSMDKIAKKSLTWQHIAEPGNQP
jgi:hypothetical protein